MRILVDLQGCQNLSKDRGIGRYSFNLVRAMACHAGDHEVWIALNGRFPETVDGIRAAFAGIIPEKRIVVWQTLEGVAGVSPANHWRRRTSEVLRENFLAELHPDAVLATSLIEGGCDDSVTSVNATAVTAPVAAIIYDLIPLVLEEHYLLDPVSRAWYFRKLRELTKADLLLSISEFTRSEVIQQLGFPSSRVVNIAGGVSPKFHPVSLAKTEESALRAKYGLTRPFVMYTGGIEFRKNIDKLVQAYAMMPSEIRASHQLAIVSKIEEHQRQHFQKLAQRLGLSADALLMIGFVPDSDLVALYNLCRVFVFPSLYEGLGLPPLEAMACGAPVIASNTTSLPEVIGREDALFDPADVANIAHKLLQVLTNPKFRESLSEHGLRQAEQFSWSKPASRTLRALKHLHEDRCNTLRSKAVASACRPTIAYISPLSPEESGIASYSDELLLELARYYAIDLIVDQPEVCDPWLQANFPIRAWQWFDQHADRYDRVLYHFANSHLHSHMFNLLERHPGVVVLQDFYLSEALCGMDTNGYAPGVLRRELYQSHGYAALKVLAEDGEQAAVWKYPCNQRVIERADGVIVHSRDALELADDWYGEGTSHPWRLIPQPFQVASLLGRTEARARLGMQDDDFLVCSFSCVAPSRLSHRLLDEWLASSLARDPYCRLVFVGGAGDDYSAALAERIRRNDLGDRVSITGYIPDDALCAYLAAADLAVQLHVAPGGPFDDSFFKELDCGVPSVVNTASALDELPENIVARVEEEFEDGELSAVLQRVRENPARCSQLKSEAQQRRCTRYPPDRVASMYRDAIEHFAQTGRHARRKHLLGEIAQIGSCTGPSDADLVEVAMAIVENTRPVIGTRQLLVDVTAIASQDYGTGIPRVGRSIARQLLLKPPSGFRVEMVSAITTGGYTYARRFASHLLSIPPLDMEEDPVEIEMGDVFLGLDWVPQAVPGNQAFYGHLRQKGGQVLFLIYDLLPELHPKWFTEELATMYTRWIETVTTIADGGLCISRSTCIDLLHWLERETPQRVLPFKLGWFHLGSEVEDESPASGLGDSLAIHAASDCPLFLMVGSLEPRKGHEQVLGAFDIMWDAGIQVGLMIVGKQAHGVDNLAARVRNHPILGSQLFWLDSVTDHELSRLYNSATALIMASQAEGFGLPLIEAARYSLPIIARDIPVFREICDDHAFYFDGTDAESLASAIKDWLELHRQGKAPSVEGMPVLTWEQSTQQLLDVILNGNWYKTWEPDDS